MRRAAAAVLALAGLLFAAPAFAACGGNLTAQNNLAAVCDKSAARTNLGLANANTVAIPFLIDGGGSAVATGIKGAIEVTFPCTITAARVRADQSGSIAITIKKAAYNGSMTSIVASAKPTLSSAQWSQDSTLTGWTTSISAGDWLEYTVDSATTVTNVTVSLTCVKP